MRPARSNTPDLQPRPSASSSLARLSLPVQQKTSSGVKSSATWTSTSGDLSNLSDTDELGDRTKFVKEYNRLAKKYGTRLLVPDHPDDLEASGIIQKRGWWSRTFRRTSSQSTENSLRRQRSTSHVMSHLAHPKRDSLRDQDLQGLVRLCGKSFFYLPPEYAPGSLLLPTCFRSTAQHLVQHAPGTRGVFRIPGSVRVVNELYEFYCVGQSGDVASTVRSPNLPVHINASIHDVASCFKKFLSGLPGGILGSLSLFDSMIAINSQLYGDPEFSRTKQSKIRARLIALAVSTLRSQFRRELICAVFGLLCLLGRTAETAPREDEGGRPLPTSDLMGYNALGIVFGPLLVGDMLDSYTVKLADPCTGLFLAPSSPASSKSQKGSQKGKKKAKGSTEDLTQQHFLHVDKIHVANDITEMLVTNWRDVAKQMRSLDADMGILRSHSRSTIFESRPRRSNSFGRNSENEPLATSRLERYAANRPLYYDQPTKDEPRSYRQYRVNGPRYYGRYGEDEVDPRDRGRRSKDQTRTHQQYPDDEPRAHGRRLQDRHGSFGAPGTRAVSFRQIDSTNDALSVKKTRPTSVRSVSNMRAASGQLGILPPPREESAGEDRDVHPALRVTTPLKSSLKATTSKVRSDLPPTDHASGHVEALAVDQITTSPSPPRSPDQVVSGISPTKKHSEPFQSQPHQQMASSEYSSEAHEPLYDQDKPETSHSVGASKTDYDHPRHQATPPTFRSTWAEEGYSRQRASPARSDMQSREYDLVQRRTNPTHSTSHNSEDSQVEAPRVGHGRPQQRLLSPADRLANTWKPGCDHPRPQSTPSSDERPRPITEDEIEYAENERSQRCTSGSSAINDQQATISKGLNQIDGSPDKNLQQPSTCLDPMIAYGSRPGMKFLRAPSTMRSQPKMPHVNPGVTPAKLRSNVWTTSSRWSGDSVVLTDCEALKKSDSGPKPVEAAFDQMDGAADCIVSVPSFRGSFMDLRGEFERRGVRDSQLSSLPVSKNRAQPRKVLTKKNGQSKKPSWTTPCKSSPRSTLTRRGVKPCASKVMGLASMFDSAAKASPFIPTPGGAIPKKRSETARVVSPYTSNPSPRASIQSVTSVSTPISLMSPARPSIDLSTPSRSSVRKSMIPRLQNISATYSTGGNQRQASPISVTRQKESRFSMIPSTPSRARTPSHLPFKKKVSTNEPPSLPQFDGVSSAKQSVLKLTAQQEIHPVGYYSSPVPQTRSISGAKRVPQLSQHTACSRHGEDRGYNRESNSLSPSLSGIRSASSLSDQIRNLRTELTSMNEDCAQLRLELDKSRKAKEVNKILLRESLDRAEAETLKWRRRAEKADKKVEKYERLAMQIKDARDHAAGHNDCLWERRGDALDDYSFVSGSDHLTISDRIASQPLTARMNQSVRRTPPVGASGANSMGNIDGFSECSSSTVVRTRVDPEANGRVNGSGLWTAVDELVDFASPGLLEGQV